MRMRVPILLLAVLGSASIATPILSQEDPHAACVGAGWVPPGILDRPLPIRATTGNSKDKVITASPEAFAYYTQGLNYLHGYSWIEGARSFKQALRLDPSFAMAHWGLSRVYSGLDDHEKAVAAAKLAKQFASTPREQRRAALRLTQLDAIADLGNAGLLAAYKQAIDKTIAADIDDVELWLIRGNAEEPTAAGRGQRGTAASTAFYLEALRRAPENGAAHHYLTHSYENINVIASALEHGEVYARVAASIPHAHHMWGHDLRRVGRLDEAIAAFSRTNDLENAYYKEEKIAAEYDWHHVHNLDLLATAHEHKGQMRRAETLLREALAVKPLIEAQEFNQKSLTVFLMGRERWKEALKTSQGLIKAQSASTRVVGYTYAGHSHLGLRDKQSARRALASAEQELSNVPTIASGVGIARNAVMPYVDALRAELMLRDGQAEEGRALLKDVQSRLRALPGPDAWTQALFRLEAFARMARDVGDWELAGYTAKQMLEHDAAYGGSHLALALVAQQRGDVDAAQRDAAAARGFWRDADKDMRELKQLGKVANAGRATANALQRAR
jgi:tetratricopeptide (TPR) repeat protein